MTVVQTYRLVTMNIADEDDVYVPKIRNDLIFYEILGKWDRMTSSLLSVFLTFVLASLLLVDI